MKVSLRKMLSDHDANDPHAYPLGVVRKIMLMFGKKKWEKYRNLGINERNVMFFLYT